MRKHLAAVFCLILLASFVAYGQAIISGGGIRQLIAGANITLTPSSGLGSAVTIASSGGSSAPDRTCSASNPSAVTLVDAADSQCDISALAQAITITLPATCTSLNHFLVRIKDTGSSHAITWSGTILDLQDTHPTATVAGKQMYLGFDCNASNVLDFTAYNVQP